MQSPRQRPEATFAFSSFSAQSAKDEEATPLDNGEKEKILIREAESDRKEGVGATSKMMEVLEGRKGASSSVQALFVAPTVARSGLIGLTAIFKSVAGIIPSSSSSAVSDELWKAVGAGEERREGRRRCQTLSTTDKFDASLTLSLVAASSLDRASLLVLQASLLKKELALLKGAGSGVESGAGGVKREREEGGGDAVKKAKVEV